MNKLSDLDGEVVLNYEILSANNPIRSAVSHSPRVVNYAVLTANNPMTENYLDQDDFYPANGVRPRTSARSARRARRAERRAGRRPLFGRRAERKRMEAQAQLETARSLNRDSKADIALAQSIGKLGGQRQRPQAKKGLSTMAWVGIGAGVLAILGVTIYLIKRKK